MSEELTLLPCPACGASDVVMRVDTRAYVFCTVCGMCGPCAPKVDTEYVASQWNILPRALTWTNEPPKVPGKYWNRDTRHPNEAGIIIVAPSRIEQLKRMSKPTEQWAGPIPESCEPK